MGLPWVAVTSLIIPFGQVPSSTSTVAPFRISNGSCLTMVWALQVPLAKAHKINAAGLMMWVLMSKVRNEPARRSSPSLAGSEMAYDSGAPRQTTAKSKSSHDATHHPFFAMPRAVTRPTRLFREDSHHCNKPSGTP
jgi:hypothetical protein